MAKKKQEIVPQEPYESPFLTGSSGAVNIPGAVRKVYAVINRDTEEHITGYMSDRSTLAQYIEETPGISKRTHKIIEGSDVA